MAPVLQAATTAGVAAPRGVPDVLALVVDEMVGSASASDERAAGDIGPVRRKDVNRIFKYARTVLRESLVTIQADTLSKPFIAAAERALEQAALSKLGRAAFIEKMDALASRYGAGNYRSSYANTWYDTIVLNGVYNRALGRAYESPPTRNLFPFFAFRDAGIEGVRPSHHALNGFVARVDWDGWPSYVPPLDWNCRCRRVPVSFVIAKALGWIGKDFPLGTDFLQPRTVGGVPVTPGRSPRFNAPFSLAL